MRLQDTTIFMIRPLPNPVFNVSTPDGKDGIRLIPLVVEKDYRDEILATWRTTKQPSRTYNTNNGRERGRRSFDVELADKIVLEALIETQVRKLATTYNYVGREPTKQSSVVLVYDEGAGCSVHCDDQDSADADYGVGTTMFNWANQLVALLYLSTQYIDFRGGELYFPNAGLVIPPCYGLLVTFPGHYKYKHGVAPITSGERILLQTTWRFDL